MEKMNLYQKLLHIQKEVDSFIKDTEGHNYSYVSGNQVLGKIRPLMNELGLLLKPEITSIDNERMDYKTKYGEKSEILSKVMFKMTWVDCDSGDKDENLWGANGQNDWDKGVGSAMTYAERYFLLKFFHVPTDADDVDNKKKSEEQTPTQQKPTNQTPKENITWLTEEQFKKALSSNKAGIEATLNTFNTSTKKMKKEYKEQLENKLKQL